MNAESRTYSSPLRQQQAEDTRRRIVEAAVDLIAQEPEKPFSHEEIAKRAGIALRTVYRHFPSRPELLAAVWQESDRRLQLIHYPETEQALLESLPAIYGGMDENGSLIRGLLSSNAGQEMRRNDNERRLSCLEQAIRPATAHLSETERRQVLGVFTALYGGRTWQLMRDRAHLQDGEVTQAVDWAMRTLLAQLYRDQEVLAREGKGSAQPSAVTRQAEKKRSSARTPAKRGS